MGNVFCNGRKVSKINKHDNAFVQNLDQYELRQEIRQEILSELNQERIEEQECLMEEIRVIKKKMAKYKNNLQEYKSRLEMYQTKEYNKDVEISRLNDLLNLKQKGNFNLLSKIQKLENMKQGIYTFLKTDDCIIVNSVVQNTPPLDCDWFQSSLFDKTEYIQLVVEHLKKKIENVLVQTGIKKV
uniref:Uncharacterized protein n=1 Tax=Pyramimonas orientalis virus TaxID=455367 RepID=A0A7L9AYY1_POV01|nr:hypothetical protein HWQ62_00355 [Pyramimonas orientalis virus]